MCWLCTLLPAMWLLLPVPLTVTIAVATPTFSPPRSERTLDGHPHSFTAVMNKCKTLWDRLFVEAFRNIIRREKPSIPPWITNRHLMRQWRPSICHNEFGAGTLYARRLTVVRWRVRTDIGLTRWRDSLTFLRGTWMLILLRWPHIIVIPLLGKFLTSVDMILSSSASDISAYCPVVIPSSFNRLQRVVLDIIITSAISSQEKPNSRKNSTCMQKEMVIVSPVVRAVG